MALAALIVLPLLWFSPVLFGGRTLIPFDNLYSFEPWHSLQPGVIPHNDLLSDLVLQNTVWKYHVVRTLAQGEIPLWNPQIFTGIPFFAGGQASVAYPLSVLFYVLPIEAAYGWFTALQLAIAGINMYIFGRVLRLRPAAALFSGVVFQFSGFMIVSVVFTMIIAAAAWLPLLLAIIEFIVRKQEEKGDAAFHPVPYVVVGAAVIGIVALAGHPEFFYYTLLVAGFYSAVRLVLAWRRLAVSRWQLAGGTWHATDRKGRGAAKRNSQPALRNPQPAIRILKLSGWLLALALLGIASGAVQLVPLYELVTLNFRAGSATLQQVLGWAWPSRHVLTFFLPDVFGNPSHHAWFDLWSLRMESATVNALGEPIQTVFWGIKNYVEGGNYVGILTWLLAAVAVVTALPWAISHSQSAIRNSPLARPTWIFTALAVLSLLFAFGTPLYAILFYGLPGWNQLHSPFRWVFPFTLSMAVLGGIGLERQLAMTEESRLKIGRLTISHRSLFFVLSSSAILAGVAALAAVAISYFVPAPFLALGQRIVDGSDLAQMSFADGRMFWGYQSLNLLKFGIFAVLGGVAVRLIISSSRYRLASSLPFLAAALVVADLFSIHGTFNPAADPALSPLVNVPPVVQFIQDREAGEDAPPFRITTFNVPGAKTLNANVGMYYGWHDLRGYDSIIPRQYVEMMNQLGDQSGELLYNRIAPLYAVGPNPYAVMENPLLDLLNVKYVFTEHVIPNAATWQEIYDDGVITVYENLEVLPRAFIVPEAQVIPAGEQPLLTAKLRDVVFIEETPAAANALTRASPQIAEANISRYTTDTVFVDINLSDRGWLVLSDAWFPGWRAYIRPFGGDESQETELTIHRANGALRTVYLPEQGQWTVRFVYTPMSFKVALYVSFLAVMACALLLLWWLWGRYYRPDESGDEVRTVAKNSLVPMALNMANKAIDFAFALLYVRLLGPEGTGQYAFVVTMYGFFEIVSRYGLGTLLTRDVAADKNQSSRYLTNVLGLRTILWLASLPVLALMTGGFRIWGGISMAEVQAIAIFAAAMLFANWADALSSLFYAFEKMEYPAGLSSATALLKVALGALVLLLGWGFVGLAWVSLVMNIVQLIWLYTLVRSTLFKPEWKWDASLQRWMFSTSGPLMLNHLLATIFWRIDVWLLRPLAGAVSVGLYSASLKYLDGLNIIPSTFTFAIFPLMARYAKKEGEGLLRSYILSARLLLMVSLPLAMTITVLAEPLIYILGGAEFLNVPDTIQVLGREISYRGGSALALQVIIWSIPIGFVNSVTQFVLIAVNQQGYLTKAFVLGVVFNVVGNLLMIPTFGYLGAAVVTILSEFSLLIPFYWSVKRHVGHVPWLDLIWRPLLAVLVMGIAMHLLIGAGINVWLALVPGGLAYLSVLALTGAFRGEEMGVILGRLLKKSNA